MVKVPLTAHLFYGQEAKMKVNYDRLWKLLIDKKMKRTDLITKAQISSNVVAKMGKEEPVSMESVGKICALFGCTVDDILEIIPDSESEILEVKDEV